MLRCGCWLPEVLAGFIGYFKLDAGPPKATNPGPKPLSKHLGSLKKCRESGCVIGCWLQVKASELGASSTSTSFVGLNGFHAS